MPIYEFGCPKCRVIFSFLSKRLNPERLPVCPKCGNRKMEKQLRSYIVYTPHKYQRYPLKPEDRLKPEPIDFRAATEAEVKRLTGIGL